MRAQLRSALNQAHWFPASTELLPDSSLKKEEATGGCDVAAVAGWGKGYLVELSGVMVCAVVLLSSREYFLPEKRNAVNSRWPEAPF